eukprot:2647858-Rhodomonas_salina.11
MENSYKTMRMKDCKISFPVAGAVEEQGYGGPLTNVASVQERAPQHLRLVYMESYPDVDKEGKIISENVTRATLEREQQERDELKARDEAKRKGKKPLPQSKTTKKKVAPTIPRLAGIYYDNVTSTWYSLGETRRRKPVDGCLFYHPVLGRVVKCVSNNDFREIDGEFAVVEEIEGGLPSTQMNTTASAPTRTAFDALPDTGGMASEDEGGW